MMKRNIRKCILLSFALSAFFLNGCSTPSKNSETPETPAVPVVVESEEMGNTNSNILNGGHAVLYGDWIYYMNFSEDYSLYRMKTDGTEESLVVEDFVYLLNASGDWLYYASGKEDGKIFKIRPDGSEKTLVIDSVSMNMIVSDDHIYFIDFSIESGPDMFKIFRVRTDGTERKKISEHMASYFSIADEWIYYLREDEQRIYRVKKDGSEDSKVSDMPVSSFTLLESSIYYTPHPNESGLFKMDMDGSGNMELSDEPVSTFTVSKEWIYYENIFREAPKSDDDKSDPVIDYELKKMRLDGTEAAVLENLEIFSLSISGDWLIYALMDETSQSIRQTLVKTDGTGRKDFVLDLSSPGDNVEIRPSQEALQAGDLTITVNSTYSTNISLWSSAQSTQLDEFMVDGTLLFINLMIINDSTSEIDLENMTGVTIGNNTYIGQYADITDRQEKNNIRFHLPLEEYKSSILLKPGEEKQIQMYCSPDERAFPVNLDIVDSSYETLARVEISPDEEYYIPTSNEALIIMKERFPAHEVLLLGQRVIDDEGKMYYTFEVKNSGSEDPEYYLMKRDTEEIFYGVPAENDPDLLRLGEPLK